MRGSVIITRVDRSKVTLEELERAGEVPKTLIGHLNEVYPAGWRHLTLAEVKRMSAQRTGRFRAEILELENEWIDAQLRIAANQDRLDEIERLQRPETDWSRRNHPVSR